jgi:nanoRNase/pAp phosphatase (c-di-AMP/oligoRNAs hydrolase)
VTEGRILQAAARRAAVKAARKLTTRTDSRGWTYAMGNVTTAISETADALLSEVRPEVDYVLTYFDIPLKGRRVWSLRSRKGSPDVSLIATQFGGGGHAAAAGFEQNLDLQFVRP